MLADDGELVRPRYPTRSCRSANGRYRTTWRGRRDYTLLLLAVQTGLRLSELIGLNRDAIHLGAGASRAMCRQGAERSMHAAVHTCSECSPGMARERRGKAQRR